MRGNRSGRRCLLGALALLAPPALTPSARADAPPTASFEALAHGAVRTRDVATLLAPLIDSCGGDMRELDRTRCRATTSFLRRKLPSETFEAIAGDPASVEVSAYDGAVKGYHVQLAGCLACSEPLPIGGRGEHRFVTLGKPDRSAAALAAGVPVAHNTFAFDNFAAAKRWNETERPFLQAEFLFQPQAAGADFTVGMAPGIALKLVGARVYNRCTGEVLMSQPPSTGRAELPLPGHQDPDCAHPPEGAEAPAPTASIRPEELSKSAITDAMNQIRPRLFDCYEKFRAPGALVLSYVVGGNGAVQSVQVGSAFAGTPTGSCALEIAKEARFPSFKRSRQEFKYLFYLRHP